MIQNKHPKSQKLTKIEENTHESINPFEITETCNNEELKDNKKSILDSKSRNVIDKNELRRPEISHGTSDAFSSVIYAPAEEKCISK